MMPVLIFSGTTEGRTLAALLQCAEIPCKVCVATEYGSEVMPTADGISVHTGRLAPPQMLALMYDE